MVSRIDRSKQPRYSSYRASISHEVLGVCDRFHQPNAIIMLILQMAHFLSLMSHTGYGYSWPLAAISYEANNWLSINLH